MNLPNKLTVFRIILVPIIVLFLLSGIRYKFCFSLVVFLLASYTDHLDGKYARKLGIITSFGKIMDPLADKILVSSVMICLIELKLVSALPVVVIVAREFIITSVRFLLLESKNIVLPANVWGKLKTVSQIVAICYVFLYEAFSEFGILLLDKIYLVTFFRVFLIWTCMFFSVISGVVYILKSKKYINLN